METAETAAARYLRSLALLAEGRYREGFIAYEARWHVGGLTLGQPPPWPPRWRGEDLKGRNLLIWPEQGLGDAIMAARFMPVVAAAMDVTLAARASQARLFTALNGVKIQSLGESFEMGGFDYVATDFEIAAQFLIRGNLPAKPYLCGTPTVVGGIGVVTKGNPGHPNDSRRSLPEELAEELLSLPGAISLHPEDTGAADFQETADLIAGLDLVVSVDTSVAHLAGAMGKPVSILLPATDTDWRWGRGGCTTPWYPSATLYRQTSADDWRAVIDQVLDDLGADEDRQDKTGAAQRRRVG